MPKVAFKLFAEQGDYGTDMMLWRWPVRKVGEKIRSWFWSFIICAGKDAAKAQPNAAHKALAKLEEKYDVQIITQNVDDLHERGGSSKVLHLHGLLKCVRSTKYPDLVYDIGDKAIQLGDACENGEQLRPHIVWFGEAVPMIEPAILVCAKADIFIVIGTSMGVYPAASLIHYVPEDKPKYLIDPNIPPLGYIPNFKAIAKKATVGVVELVEELM